MLTNWFEKKVLILGLSVSGIAAAKFLNRHGADVYITEFSQAKPEQLELIKELESLGIKVETGGHSDEFLNDAYIGDNTVIENCIVESRDTIHPNMRYQGTPEDIKIIIEKNDRYNIN